MAAAGTVFGTEHKRLMLTTPHAGPGYDKDNDTLGSIMMALSVQGPGWANARDFEKKRGGGRGGGVQEVSYTYSPAQWKKLTKDEQDPV